MNSKLAKFLDATLTESEKSDFGSLLQLKPHSLTREQRNKEEELWVKLIRNGIEEIPFDLQDFSILTSSGHVETI